MKKLLIANRGEIACRIARTAKRMGIATCGVYTPQDLRTRHVRELDEIVALPAGELAENYLNQKLLIHTAIEFGADSVHPGYGFLAENPEFAEQTLRAGLIWVGPKPDAMRKLGGKIEAKEIAVRAGVPVVPWKRLSHAPAPEEVQQILDEIGLPLLIKAAHGGGGRGQRVVPDVSQFVDSLRSARSEAERSFGSGEVFVEKFLEHPRHVEIQILGDEHGNIFTFGERDCTLQRRNQKIVEEAPASILDPDTRRRMIDSARALASAVRYNNAGTIEFLAQSDAQGSWNYYFMELNARLQVEHPVTEMIWGIDLVELQLRSAQGEKLSGLPEKPSGHAIEIRLCAEDPARQFLPTPGPITEWICPDHPDLRVESGFEMGDVVPQEYDSLIAKLICKGTNREDAIRKCTNVLDGIVIGGVLTNQYFLRSVLSHPDYLENRIHTRWIDSHPVAPSERLDSDLVFWGKKFCSELFVQRGDSAAATVPAPTELLLEFAPEMEIHGTHSPQGLVRIAGRFRGKDNGEVYATGWISRFEMCLSFQKEIEGVGQRRIAFAGQFEIDDVRAHHGPILAQMPGVVLDVRAAVDQIVQPQSPILIIEAMKIEMPMSLPVAAKITAIRVKRGDRIQPGQTLVTWEPLP